MAELEERPQVGCSGTIRVVIIIIIGIFLCSGGMFFAVDSRCVSLASTWIPVYPNSELVFETHEYLRPFGAGQTRAQYSSPDDITTVRQWYIDHRSELGLFNDGQIANFRYSVSEATDKTGSMITLISRCAWSE